MTYSMRIQLEDANGKEIRNFGGLTEDGVNRMRETSHANQPAGSSITINVTEENPNRK